MHFNSDYQSYKGSSTDFLAFDNGQRNIPIDRNLNSFYNQSLNDLYIDNLNADFPNLSSQDYNTINNLANSFNPVMASETEIA